MKTIRLVSRVLAAAVPLAAFAVPIPAFGAQLTCTSSSFTASASGGNIIVSCTEPGSGSTTCTLSANPTSVPATGGSVSLSANCGTVSSWTGGKSATGGSSSSWTDTIPANTGASPLTWGYTVNGSGGNAMKFVTQAAQGSAPPPATGDVAAACTAAGYKLAQVIEMGWKNARYVTKGFRLDNVVVLHFRTPNATAPGVKGGMSGGEMGGGPKMRHSVLSDRPCDFTKPENLYPYSYADNTNAGVDFYVGGSNSKYPVLQPGRDYYLNIRNDRTCPAGNLCDMYMDFSKPAGL